MIVLGERSGRTGSSSSSSKEKNEMCERKRRVSGRGTEQKCNYVRTISFLDPPFSFLYHVSAVLFNLHKIELKRHVAD